MLRLVFVSTWAPIVWAHTIQMVKPFSTSYQPTASLLATQSSNTHVKTICAIKRGNSTLHTADPIVTKLSEQQKALRLKIYQHGKSENRTLLRKERNNILRLTSKRLKEVAVEEEDALADQITSTNDCRRMFRAAKQLCSTKPTPPIIVQDTDGNLIGTDKGKAKAIKDWFQALSSTLPTNRTNRCNHLRAPHGHSRLP